MSLPGTSKKDIARLRVVADVARRRAKMLVRLRQIASDATIKAFAVESSYLLPTESLDDWGEFRTPKTHGEMKAVERRLQARLGAVACKE